LHDEWAYPEEQYVMWGDDPQRGRGNFGGKLVPDKPNTGPCRGMQTIGTDA